MRTAILTVLTMVAFATNSILCRLALGRSDIDPASFTTVRVGSGAVVLLLIATSRRAVASPGGALSFRIRGTWASAAALFLYALCFSFAYVSLTAGTGALILFGAVQATMLLAALRGGERPNPMQWIGLVAALAGLVYLVLPGLSAPPLGGSILMATAGIGWGIYSLRGRAVVGAVEDTTSNFVRSAPLAVLASLLAAGHLHLTGTGLLLAVASGALASGVGYVVWYAALAGLTATRAATVQLSVPVIAAAGGVLLLNEEVTLRLVLATILILGGVGLALAGRERLVHHRHRGDPAGETL